MASIITRNNDKGLRSNNTWTTRKKCNCRKKDKMADGLSRTRWRMVLSPVPFLFVFFLLSYWLLPLIMMKIQRNWIFDLTQLVIRQSVTTWWHRQHKASLPPDWRLRASIQIIKTSMCAGCLILLVGDASINPGPVKHPCAICDKCCRINQQAIQCNECDLWHHSKCIDVSHEEYFNLSQPRYVKFLKTFSRQ